MTDHRFLFAQVNATATASTPQGTVTPAKRGGKTGRYTVTFSKNFANAPAVTLIGATGKQAHTRVTAYKGANRLDHVNVDGYELKLADGVNGSVDWVDTSFNMIAALSGGAGVGNLKRTGATDADLRVVAGVVDGTGPSFNALVNYGGYSLDPNGRGSEKGLYILRFDDGFAEAPVVMATLAFEDTKVRTVHVLESDATSAKIQILNSDGERGHGNFHFLAVGKATTGKATTTGRLVTGAITRTANTKLAGQGFDSQEEEDARYTITLDKDYRFSEAPVIVATAEHGEDKHLRQAQVHDVDKKQFKLDIYGFKKKSNQNFNDSAFHFIAYAPS